MPSSSRWTGAWTFPGLVLLLSVHPVVVRAATKVGLVALERVGDQDPAYDSLELSLHRQAALLGDTPATDVILSPGCPATQASCLAQAGKLAGADVVFAGSVERFPDGYVLRIRAAPTSGGEGREVKRLVSGGAPDLIAAAESASCELLRIESCTGTLRVTGPVGGRLLIDGKDAGLLPFNGSVAIGRHSLRASVEGRSSDEIWQSISWKQEVGLDVSDRAGRLVFEKSEFATLPEMAAVPPPPPPVVVVASPPPVSLSPPVPTPSPEPAPASIPAPEVTAPPAPPPPATAEVPLPAVITALPPPPPDAAPPATPAATTPPGPVEAPQQSLRPPLAGGYRIGFLSAAGATGGLLLGGVIAGSVSLATANALNDKFSHGTLTPADKSGYASARGAAATANVFYGLGLLGAVTTGVLFLIDPRVAGSGGDGVAAPAVSVGASSVTVQGQF